MLEKAETPCIDNKRGELPLGMRLGMRLGKRLRKVEAKWFRFTSKSIPVPFLIPIPIPMPKLVVVLGFLGILPFLVAIVWPSLLAFKIYSLAILAFLSGNWWSTALLVRSQSEVQLTLTILFSNLVVLAAVAVVFVEHSVGLFVLALLYLLMLIGERQLSIFEKQPKYYAAMRFGVTTVVVLLHLLAAWRF